MTNKNNTVLYTGITNSLTRRGFEHRNKLNKDSFSAKYNISKLVYYAIFNNPAEAIEAEKKIKNWKREWKIELIEKENLGLKDLFDKVENDINN